MLATVIFVSAPRVEKVIVLLLQFLTCTFFFFWRAGPRSLYLVLILHLVWSSRAHIYLMHARNLFELAQPKRFWTLWTFFSAAYYPNIVVGSVSRGGWFRGRITQRQMSQLPMSVWIKVSGGKGVHTRPSRPNRYTQEDTVKDLLGATLFRAVSKGVNFQGVCCIKVFPGLPASR